METVLLGSFLTQYDAVKATFKEMKPFLNINEETGPCYYRLIFLLKIIYVVYAFYRAFQKQLSLIFKYVGELYGICINPDFGEILPMILSAFVILNIKEPSTSISGEFLTDIFMLFFSLSYAFEAYKRELQKISGLIFMCLFVQWYINHTANSEQFRLRSYFQVLSLLFLSYIPMMPNNPRYRRRLTYLYILMYIWIFYKIGQHYDRHHYLMQEYKIKTVREDLHTKLESVICKLNGTLQNVDMNNEIICSHIENMQSSCCTKQKVVTSKAAFTSNQEMNITEKLEEVSKPASFSKVIQSEDSRNTIESDILDVKDVKKDSKNSEHRTGTLRVHDAEEYQPSISPKSSVVENEQKAEDTVFKLPKTDYIYGESAFDESKNVQSKFSDDEIYKSAQSEEANIKELPQSGLESTSEASKEENHVIEANSKAGSGNEEAEVADSSTEADKPSNKKHETSESNDSSFKPEGKNTLNAKRTIRIFKRHGEISEAAASNEKTNKHGSRVGNNDSTIQKSTLLKNKSQVLIRNGIQGTAGGNLTNIAHMRKVNLIKIGHNIGTELQIKNHGVSNGKLLITNKHKKQGIIRPVRIVQSAKQILPSKMSKLIVKGRDKDGPGSESGVAQ